MKRISVIVPVYNAEKYLDKCIQSIIGQTYKNYEILLIDDGSTDLSGEMIDQYAGNYHQIKAVHTENGGPASARKKGIGCAAGEYIMFVDADDWLDSELLEFALTTAEESNADIVCLGHKEVYENEQIRMVSSQESENLNITGTVQMMLHLHGTRLIDSGPWAKLMKRNLFDQIDFCENVTIGEDYFMVLQLLERADSVVLRREALYNRCIRMTSISRSGYSERHRQAFGEYMKWRSYLLERYPQLRKEIISYHTEYEMAVITAMCRNRNYDRVVIRGLAKDLRENREIVLRCQKTPFYMKVSAVLIAYCYPLFILIFRCIHLLSGR